MVILMVTIELIHLDGLVRANLSARIAARAFLQVNHVPRVRGHRNCVHRAMLGAEHAAGAFVFIVVKLGVEKSARVNFFP
jgi:hypothetical protein